MRPRLVFLAFLLLALCSEIVALTPAEAVETKELLDKYDFWYSVYLARDYVLHPQNMPVDETKKNLIYNSVTCEMDVDHDKNAKTLRKKEYGAEDASLTSTQLTEENKLAKAIGIECSTPANSPEWKCFCTDKHGFTYCAASKFYNLTIPESFKPTVCWFEAEETLENAGTKEYFEFFQQDGASDLIKRWITVGSNDAAQITNYEDAERANLFCDAVDPKVEEAVKAYYTSDIFFITLEEVILQQLSESVKTKLLDNDGKCGNKAIVETFHTMKCYCSRGMSHSTKGTFCALYAIGKYFEEEGYLSCDGAEKKFDKTKRPAPFDPSRPMKDSGSTAASPWLFMSAAAAALLLAH